jgi:antitoxin (DNA-binding transcriptional repressor) of toxin-antitoxin stability system
MEVVSISDAMTRLPALVERVAAGEEIAISRDTGPPVRLTRLEPRKRTVVFGLLRDKVVVSPDFDEPLPSAVQRSFEDTSFPSAAGT